MNYVSYDNIKKIVQKINDVKQSKIPVSDTKSKLELADGEIGIALKDGIFYKNGDELVSVSGSGNGGGNVSGGGNEIDLSDYYTKGETDEKIRELIGDTDIDLSDYYTKEETDGKIGEFSGSMEELSQGLDAIEKDLSSEVLNRTEADDALGERIDAIEAKIPSAASDENQLADKAFVNSSIGTNTAHFIETFDSLDELKAYSGDKTNNDYAFVKTTDEAGNTLYNRYKWNDEKNDWIFEYALNNSSFTQTQWNAINSGATEELIEKIKDGNGTEAGLLRLSDAVDGTQGTDDATAATPSAVKKAYDLANAANENADASLNRLDSEEAARTEADDALGKRIDAMEAKIPSAASEENQLADKSFVHRYVANFRGEWPDWVSVPSNGGQYPADYSGNHNPTENDYMVVRDAQEYKAEIIAPAQWEFKNRNADSGEYVWNDSDGNAYYSRNGTNLQFIGGEWVTKDWGDNKPDDGKYIWHDNDGNIYYSNSSKQYQLINGKWITKNWGTNRPDGDYVWHDNDGNIYYSYSTTQLQLVGGKWVAKDWGTNKPNRGKYIWYDNDGNVYYSDSSTQLQLVGGEWVTKDWGTNKPNYGEHVWHDNNGNIYFSNGGTQLQLVNGEWVTKDWGDNKPDDGYYVWHDNNGNIYFSNGGTQLQLVNGEWVAGLTIKGDYIWYDNDGNIYYSDSSTQLQFVGGEWVTKDWGTNKPNYGKYIWYDNDGNVYYSSAATQLQLVGGEWIDKNWKGNSPGFGNYVWHDNDGNVYNSYRATQYQLVSGEWVTKDWGTNRPDGEYVWHDNDGNIYYSYNATQFQLVNGEWVTKNWGTNKPSNGKRIWHDNDGNVYYSDYSSQYQLVGGEWVTKDWGTVRTDGGDYIWHDNNGNIYYSYNGTYLQFIPEQHVADRKGAWRFKYTGDWASKGKDGWEPEYSLGSSLLDYSVLNDRYQTLDKASQQDKEIEELGQRLDEILPLTDEQYEEILEIFGVVPDSTHDKVVTVMVADLEESIQTKLKVAQSDNIVVIITLPQMSSLSEKVRNGCQAVYDFIEGTKTAGAVISLAEAKDVLDKGKLALADVDVNSEAWKPLVGIQLQTALRESVDALQAIVDYYS